MGVKTMTGDDSIRPGDVYAYRCYNDQGYGIMVPVKTSDGWDFIDTYHLHSTSMKPGETLDEASVRNIIELGSGDIRLNACILPDSWEKLEEDARMKPREYVEERGITVERNGQVATMTSDILRRAKTLAGLIDRPNCGADVVSADD